jgi:phage portal protein BeeE
MMVLTGGMEFKEIQAAPKDTQLADILKLTVEEISRAFHYPIFKLGGAVPALAGNIESLITTYYTDCLQHLIESLELCLDEGLALPNGMGTEMDLDNLFRMDISALFDSNSKAVDGGWMKPDEARFRANLSAVPGGNTPYMQQQNFSLAALSKRDAKEDPFASNKPVKTPAPAPQAPPPAPAAIASEDLEHIYAGEMWNQLEKRKELAA